MVSGPANFRSLAGAAVLTILALLGMHVLDMNVHTCHTDAGSATHGDGHHEDGHEHHKGAGAASCVVVGGCVAIILTGVVAVAAHRRRPRSVWPALVAAISSVTDGPEPPVPRILLSV